MAGFLVLRFTILKLANLHRTIPTHSPTNPLPRYAQLGDPKRGPWHRPRKRSLGCATTNAHMEHALGSGAGFTASRIVPAARRGACSTCTWDARCTERRADAVPGFGLEVEGPEVDRVIGRAVDTVERHTDEAGSLHVFSL